MRGPLGGLLGLQARALYSRIDPSNFSKLHSCPRVCFRKRFCKGRAEPMLAYLTLAPGVNSAPDPRELPRSRPTCLEMLLVRFQLLRRQTRTNPPWRFSSPFLTRSSRACDWRSTRSSSAPRGRPAMIARGAGSSAPSHNGSPRMQSSWLSGTVGRSTSRPPHVMTITVLRPDAVSFASEPAPHRVRLRPLK